MLASYIDKALELAAYEIIEDGGTYWGEIPGLLFIRCSDRRTVTKANAGEVNI